jgi:hypothetical protein
LHAKEELEVRGRYEWWKKKRGIIIRIILMVEEENCRSPLRVVISVNTGKEVLVKAAYAAV